MGLTYDGITYRSLEEQVRYDAEQVQALKQADVTINENLQTVNTEIDGKLTKPANPTSESAVVLGTDGTASTKPLSDISGKLYRHELNVKLQDNMYLYFYFIDNVQNYSTLADIPIKAGVGYYESNTNANCPAAFKIDNSGIGIFITTVDKTNPSAGVFWKNIYKEFVVITYSDTTIQL